MLDLDGFRFYGCSLLLIYDGDQEAQDHFARHASISTATQDQGQDHIAKAGGVGNRLERVDEGEDEWVDIRHRPSRPTSILQEGELPVELAARRSKSVEYDPIRHRHRRTASTSSSTHRPTISGNNTKRLRGEVNIRVVDFAHTTTGRDFIPFPSTHVDPPEKTLGKGYDTQIDPETGLNFARFPPKHVGQPDMGFVYGLKNVCAALEGIWRGEAGDEAVDRWLEVMENGHVFRKAFGEGVDEESYPEGELST